MNDFLTEIRQAEWSVIQEDGQTAVLATVEDGTLVVCTFGDIWNDEIALQLARVIVLDHNSLRYIDPVDLKVAADAKDALRKHLAAMGGL